MKINDVMTHRASFVTADATLAEAARIMRVDEVPYLPVCDQERVVGTITGQDIVTWSWAAGRHPDETPVRVIMSDDATAVDIDADVCAAARLMERKNIRRLPVLDHHGHLAGVVTLGDVARGQFRFMSKGARELSESVSPFAITT